MQIADSKRPPRTEIEAAAARLPRTGRGASGRYQRVTRFVDPLGALLRVCRYTCVACVRTCRLVGGTRSSDVMGIHRDDDAQLSQRALNVPVEGDDIKKESGMNPLGACILRHDRGNPLLSSSFVLPPPKCASMRPPNYEFIT